MEGFFISFVCPICKNEDPIYIGYRNGEPYCRRCISFYGEHIDENQNTKINPEKVKAIIDYQLSDNQKRISDSITENFLAHKNVLIYAVCGAGKTELVFNVIETALKKGMKVGFAIPRRDVVIELANRLSSAFKNDAVISIYGGHTDDLNGEIIVLTTHQLYRFDYYFDLLIMDEIDAFPYNDNPVLYEFFKRSVKGNYVLMSATPSENIIDLFSRGNNVILKLFTRYHGHPIPVPKIHQSLSILKIFFVILKIKKYIKEDKPLLIFAPTIDCCEKLFKKINYFSKDGDFVHSKRANRSKVIDDFRNGKTKFLVTTAVLERGVTLKNLQVIIFDADNSTFNWASLVQISGRVGRKKDFPGGDVYFLCKRKNKEMDIAIKKIKEANSYL